jgi:putative ATP-dependent endonuclease of the OLD family
MKLVSFSVTNYRSITKAYRLPIRQSVILIGPNNEGKSNILRALVTSLQVLSNLGRVRITRGRLRGPLLTGTIYDWATDYPISLQESKPDGESSFELEFELTADEIVEFAKEVKSSLNGTLPIQLTMGSELPGFKVIKKGPGGPALSKKAEQIGRFVAKRININYIPAVRTADSAHRVVQEIVAQQLATLENDIAFQQAVSAIEQIQIPVLKKISKNIEGTLKEFLPNVKKVNVSIAQEERFRAFRRAIDIEVDDGTPTALERKGDGVQSLAALSLMRHVPDSALSSRQLILAIEEPESHLHPFAIHQLKKVLTEIAKDNQVIMTTHCPLFVDRGSIKSNIIVHKNKAVPAKSVKEIRDILGVRAADNLQHAELILLVEGEGDRRSLTALLQQSSAQLNIAITQGTLAIDSLNGGTNLAYKAGLVREALCLVHCFLDYDKAGLDASAKAEQEGILTLADINFSTVQGMQEAELEDLYDVNLYGNLLMNKYGVSTASPKFKGNQKWAARMRETFKHQGKPWSDTIEARVKADISELVASNPSTALNPHHRSSIEALVASLEIKLDQLTISKVS